jgi:hypothetical protein
MGALTTAWIAATGETDTTIISALNTLETDLTTYGLTSKIKALYPMVGGTVAKHKFNFMDARDLDAAFRLTFFGGWTHSSTGALPNGTNAYADTYLNPFNYGQNDFSFGCYLRTTASYGSYIGALDSYRTYLLSTGTAYYVQINSSGYASGVISPAQTTKLHVISRTTSATASTYIDGTLLFNDNVISNGKTNRNMWVGALNSSYGGNYYSSNEQAFSFIADGLSPTDVTNLTNTVQAFQTTLSRNV